MAVGYCLVIVCHDGGAAGITARLVNLVDLSISATSTPIDQAQSKRQWVGQICNGAEIISLVARIVCTSSVDVKCQIWLSDTAWSLYVMMMELLASQ